MILFELFDLSKYGFFDYKYNIEGYSGQDYDNGGRMLYLIVSIVLLFVLGFLFRKTKKEKVLNYIRISGIVFTVMYIIKTVWESYWDIKTGRGFNTGILPLDTCSIIMWASLTAGFAKGKLKEAADGWLITGSFVGGVSNLLFLRGLIYYPFFTFGAFYSMLWHFFMVFTSVLLITTNYVELNFKTVIKAFIFHMAFSVIVITYDYIMKEDFMLYYDAGGAPLIEDIASKLAANGLRFLTTIIMIVTYFGLFNAIVFASLGIKKLIGPIKGKIGKKKEEAVAE